jgi:hypothetical protein
VNKWKESNVNYKKTARNDPYYYRILCGFRYIAPEHRTYPITEFQIRESQTLHNYVVITNSWKHSNMPIQEEEILFCKFLSLVSDSNFIRTEKYLMIYMNINYVNTPHKQICRDNLIYISNISHLKIWTWFLIYRMLQGSLLTKVHWWNHTNKPAHPMMI